MHCFIHNQFNLRFARTVLLIMLQMLSLTSINPFVTLCSVLLSLTRTSQIERAIKGEPIANSSSYFPKFKIEFGYNEDSVSVKWKNKWVSECVIRGYIDSENIKAKQIPRFWETLTTFPKKMVLTKHLDDLDHFVLPFWKHKYISISNLGP